MHVHGKQTISVTKAKGIQIELKKELSGAVPLVQFNKSHFPLLNIHSLHELKL